MKIKYIKDAPNGPAGMIDEVSDFHADILVLTGFAEHYIEKPKRKSKPKDDAGTLTDEGTKTDTDKE